MKTKILVVALMLITAASLAFAGYSFARAQSPTPGSEGDGQSYLHQELQGRPAHGPGGMPFEGPGGMQFFGLGGSGEYGPFSDKPEGAFGPLAEYIKQAVADLLGLTVEELEQAREDGTPFADLLDAAGLTVEEFVEAMKAQKETIVAQAVEDGAITQEQADFILEHCDCLRRPHRPGFWRRMWRQSQDIGAGGG